MKTKMLALAFFITNITSENLNNFSITRAMLKYLGHEEDTFVLTIMCQNHV